MRVPSTQALRALDSFARLGSIWRVAEELNLTRSAVSHQLRQLERDLGFELFVRVGRGVALTSRGRRYAHDVHKAMTLLGEAASPHDGGIGGGFRISCTPGFASLWLCTRIADFQELYPEVALTVLTPRRLDDVSNPEADAFIAYGDGNWPNCSAELLCEVRFTPLCSPALLNRLGGLAKPADVLRANLLHLGDREDWARWLALTGVENADPAGGVVFADMNLVFSAAIAGQGIAMGDALTGGKALGEGRLVRPFDIAIRAPGSYHLVVDLAKTGHPVLPAFRDWLRTSLAGAEADLRAGLGQQPNW